MFLLVSIFLEEQESLLLLWNERQRRVAQLIGLGIVVNGVVALDNELNLVVTGLVRAFGLVVVAPVDVVLTSVGIGRTSQELRRILVSQLLVVNAKPAAGIHGSFGCGQLESVWVDYHACRLRLDLSSIGRLVGSRQVQDVVITGLDPAEKGLLVGVKYEIFSVPLQQVVLENITLVVSNDGKHWRTWFVETLVDGKRRH